MNYIIQRRTYTGWSTVARVESIYDAQEWKYDHALGGEYRVTWHGELKMRFTVKCY